MAKVVVVAPYVPYPARHGGAIRSRVLLDALRLDHEVHLAAAVANDEDRAHAKALGEPNEVYYLHEMLFKEFRCKGESCASWSDAAPAVHGRRIKTDELAERRPNIIL